MRAGAERLWRGAASRNDPSAAAKLYTLVIMGLVTALAMMDRNILNILLTPIKQEIGASDTAMGLLTGTAFAFFYATAAIPMARLVDTRNRRNILALSLSFWSVATALCGLAANYWHLLLARIGVAAGEASSNPAIMSIISDHYPPSRRATAIGATLIGTGVGVMFGSMFGGYLADELGWRTAFVVVGLPGALVALLMWLTVPEPVRGASEGGLKPDPDSDTVWKTVRYLARIPSFTYITLAKSFVQIATQASLIWFPTYLVRVHGFTLTETGFYYGVAIALATICAALVGGPIADRLARRGTAWYLRFAILAVLLAAPSAVALSFTTSPAVAVALVFAYGFTASLNNTPSMAAALAIVRPRMRGFMTAVVNFIFNLIGAGLGGLIVGLFNDMLAPRYGDEAIRYSLLLMPVMLIAAAAFYFLGSLVVEKDVQKAQLSATA